MINKYLPHILVIPEDDANRQILNGFLVAPNLDKRIIQVLPPRGGWSKVLDDFKNNHVHAMQKYPDRMIILIIDFDGNEDRLNTARKDIPEDLNERVFILGVLSQPERLRATTNLSFENIGKALAEDCCDNTNKLWGHDLLKHNGSELHRMASSVKPILFKG